MREQNETSCRAAVVNRGCITGPTQAIGNLASLNKSLYLWWRSDYVTKRLPQFLELFMIISRANKAESAGICNILCLLVWQPTCKVCCA